MIKYFNSEGDISLKMSKYQPLIDSNYVTENHVL